MSTHAHGHAAVALEDLPGAAPDPTPGPTFAVGLMGILVTLVVSIFVTTLYHWSANQEAEQKVLLRGHPELEALLSRQRAQLETQRKDGKLVSISIERAMSLVQAERQAGR